MEQQQIFLNYAKTDREEMKVLARELEKNDKIVSALSKEEKIEPLSRTLEAIEKSEAMLACFSEGFGQHPLCQIALGMAYARGVPIFGVLPNRKEMCAALESAELSIYYLDEMDDLIELFSALEPTAKPVQLVHTAQDALEELKRIWEKKEKPRKTRPQKDDLEYYEEIISLLKGEKETSKVYRKR